MPNYKQANYAKNIVKYPELIFNNQAAKNLIIAPHCDDELLAVGGVMQELLQKSQSVKVVFLTNGDGFGWSARRTFKRPLISSKSYRALGVMRQQEAINAMQKIGLSSEDIIFLGYPDKGLKYLWQGNWGTDQAYFSKYTSTLRNPYLISYKKEQTYTGINLFNDLRTILEEYQPDRIFAPSPYDKHPDHWASYIFLKYALADFKRKDHIKREIYQYLVHWSGKLKNYKGDWVAYNLTDQQIKQKKYILNEYRSQMLVIKKFLYSFMNEQELFIKEDN